MLLTGDLIDAPTAAEWVSSTASCRSSASPRRHPSSPSRIAAASSETIAVGKIAFYEQLDRALPDVYTHASDVMATNAVTPDAREGIDAFLASASRSGAAAKPA